MSATPADDVQTSPAWNCGANIQQFFESCKGKCEKVQNDAFLWIFWFRGRAEGATV